MRRAPDFSPRRTRGSAPNAVRYHEYLREHDLCLTDSLIPPQANRGELRAPVRPFLAARVKEETDAGIVIRGARMLATLPISDGIMMVPSTLLKSAEEDAPYALRLLDSEPHLRACGFICRESVDYGRSHFDHPLGSRFEEMDAVVRSSTICWYR